jgi:hypothetical protein
MSRRFVVCVCVPIALLTLPAAPVNTRPASFQGVIAGLAFGGACKTVRPLVPRAIDAILDASQVPVGYFGSANVEGRL